MIGNLEMPDAGFGPPPPRYPARVDAVRKDGEIVTGDDAVGDPAELTYDLTIYTANKEVIVEGLANMYPPPPDDIDVNASTMVGYVVEVHWLGDVGSWLMKEPIYQDTVDCDEAGG